MTTTTDDTSDLVGYLKDLRLRAGQPSTRRMTAATGVSHTSIAELLAGKRMLGWNKVDPLVRHLGGDQEHALALWCREHPTRAGRGGNREDSNSTIIGLLVEIRDLLRELVERP